MHSEGLYINNKLYNQHKMSAVGQ